MQINYSVVLHCFKLEIDLYCWHHTGHLLGDDFFWKGQNEGQACCQKVILVLFHPHKDLGRLKISIQALLQTYQTFHQIDWVPKT